MSLVEMLVVIALVFLLIALLLPAISASRLVAQKSICQGNLRQLATAGHAYAADYQDKLAPIKQQTYYFNHANVMNLGIYYKRAYFSNIKLMFCPNAPRGFAQADVAHQGFSWDDYRPGTPQPFNGPYQACSYVRRSVSAQYDWTKPTRRLNWIWDGQPTAAIDDDANYSLRLSSATSDTALLADVFSHYWTYQNVLRHPAYKSIGHQYEINRVFADGSALARNDFGKRTINAQGALFHLEDLDWGSTGWPWFGVMDR